MDNSEKSLKDFQAGIDKFWRKNIPGVKDKATLEEVAEMSPEEKREEGKRQSAESQEKRPHIEAMSEEEIEAWGPGQDESKLDEASGVPGSVEEFEKRKEAHEKQMEQQHESFRARPDEKKSK